MRALSRSHEFVVGVARLELAASWSRTMRATKLRYTPLVFAVFKSALYILATYFHSVNYCNDI